MAGILDSKERVMDFIITQEGKQQAGQGELRVKFASFTDLHTFYEKSGSLDQPDLADDASNRIFFEPYSRYQDVVVPELEAGYSLRPFRTTDFHIAGKMIASGTFQVGFVDRMNILTSSNDFYLSDATPNVLAGITQNFNDLRIVGSIDQYSLSQEFSLSSSRSSFSIDNFTEYFRSSQKDDGVVQLENIPSIFNDRRFSRFPNFLYLPPENLPDPGFVRGQVLADYPKLDEKPMQTLEDILSSLKGKQVAEIIFSSTSRSNNVVCQMFETSNLGIDKLSVIDFGSFDDEDPGSPVSLASPGRRVFFVGKIRRDVSGAETFVCLFTIIID